MIGLDGFFDYYDVSLKNNRNNILKLYSNFHSCNCLLEDKNKLFNIFSQHKPKIIIHLMTQAGVRYSSANPKTYFDSNLLGTFNILDIAQGLDVEYLMIASTSSVYGSSENLPFSEKQKTDEQLYFYLATKSLRNNGALLFTYS